MNIMSFRVTISILCLLLLSFSGIAQTTFGQPPKVIPPSPDIAAFQKFGDIPVSPYTGVPNISVPLYNITTGDLNLPISINYHASGIKVTDEASRVGLGWALSAGGVITRSIMNMDDFASRTDGYHSRSTVPDLNNGYKQDPGRNINIQGDDEGNCDVIAPNNINIANYLKENVDYEPDIYNFNFLGYNGIFILKRNKEAVLLKNEKISITYLNNNGGEWQIKTPDGSTYFFAEHEVYLDWYSGYSSGNPEINTWHLTKIISPLNDIVTFTYQHFSETVRVPGSFFETNNPNVFISGLVSCGSLEPLITYYYDLPNKEYSKVYLDKIAFPNGDVSFFYSARDDIYQDAKLDKIQVNQESVGTIREWLFGYEYFEGLMDEDRNPVGTSVATRSKRLKLKSLTEKGKNGEIKSPHTFVYNNESGNAPQKVSFARDHWGYFNGKYSGIHLVPDMLGNQAAGYTPKAIGIMGANRAVDPDYNQLFILKEIKYPTGGKTAFEYETNDFDIGKSKIDDHSYFANYPEVIENQITKTYPGNIHTEQPGASQVANYLLDLTDMYSDPFQINSTAQVSLSAFFRFDGAAHGVCMPSGVFGGLYKEDGTQISYAEISFYVGQTSMPMTVCSGMPPNYIGAEFKNVYNLGPGKYLWKVIIGTGVTYIQDVHLKVTYLANKIQQDINNNGLLLQGADFGGGLRIKRIVDYDNVQAQPVNIKKYEYSYKDEAGKNHSYGRRMTQPIYSYFNKTYYAVHCGIVAPVDVFFHTWTRVTQSEPVYPLENPISGVSVGYDKVIVNYGEAGENGRTVYDFENQSNVILDYSTIDLLLDNMERIPRRPPGLGILPNYGNGNIKSQEDDKNVNGTFVPVRQEFNTYTEYEPAEVAVSYGVEQRSLQGTVEPTCQYEAFIYPSLVKSRKLLTSTTLKTFDPNSQLAIQETTSYQYDNSSHLQLTNVSKINSKNQTENTYYKYPLDYNDQQHDNAINLMKTSLFMHSKPVLIENSITEGGIKKIRNLEINKYLYNSNANTVVLAQQASLDKTGTILPAAINAYLPSSNVYPAGVTPKISYSDFTSKGQIAQLNKQNDIQLSYIWDYKIQYPIAEVTNAVQSDIAYTSFEADGTGNWQLYTGTLTAPASPPPTGKKCYNLTIAAPLLSKTIITSGKIYIISYWRNVTTNSPFTISGGSGTVTRGKTIGGWTYFEHKVTASTNTLSITGTGGLDEARLYPADAQMTTYTYNPLIGITSQCDVNNKIMYYEYDGFGRLQYIKDEKRNILKTYDYQYQVLQ
jgi:hypothetical protein